MIKTLPNGLPTYKLMHLKSTDEKCRIVKVNDTVTDLDKFSPFFEKTIIPLTVDVNVTRFAFGISFIVILEKVSIYDLEVWNEKMTPNRTVNYFTKKGEYTTVKYLRTM